MMSLHPFPARMAPDLVLDRIQGLKAGSIVLDPMMGSGTVVRQATANGYMAMGLDMDPLAVLMTRVATTPLDVSKLGRLSEKIIANASKIDGRTLRLDWIDDDKETSEFIRYWFASPQRIALRKIAKVFAESGILRIKRAEKNALLLALSRIIVTKEQRASLARDTSRSRPHKVSETNEFDVYREFRKSVKRLQAILKEANICSEVRVDIGDARAMINIDSNSIDCVITSPPYLNAIDYLRGHKMSLIWMGYSIPELRAIRSNSVGSERRLDGADAQRASQKIVDGLGDISGISARQYSMVQRYAYDLHSFTKELFRVVKSRGEVTFVIGNSCISNVFIRNSDAAIAAAEMNGFTMIQEMERELPESSRSLPIVSGRSSSLSRRMRTENVIVFRKR